MNYAGQYEWDDILARSDAWNNQQVRYGAEYRRIIEPYITRKLEGVYDIKKELGLDSHFGIKKMKQLSINPHIDANHEESLQLHPM